jgi:hypothetical protein
MNAIDIINKTPKENESFILKKANIGLLMDKYFLVWCIFSFSLPQLDLSYRDVKLLASARRYKSQFLV